MMKKKQKICKKHKYVSKKGECHEAFKRATAREIFPYDFTY